MEDLIQKVRDACDKRGTTGVSKLGKAFKIFDDDNSGKLSIEEFSKGLTDYKTGLTKEEADTLFHLVDKDNSGTINIDEFTNLIRGKRLSEKCLEIVEKVFAKMDTTNDGVLKSEDMAKYYSAAEGTSFDQYLARFDSEAYDPKNPKPVEITKEEFIEYYTSQRNKNYPNDEYFISSVGRSWGVE